MESQVIWFGNSSSTPKEIYKIQYFNFSIKVDKIEHLKPKTTRPKCFLRYLNFLYCDSPTLHYVSKRIKGIIVLSNIQK